MLCAGEKRIELMQQELSEERSHAAACESAAKARLSEVLSAKDVAEGSLVAAHREQDLLRKALEDVEQGFALAKQELVDTKEARDSLQIAVTQLRERSEEFSVERDMLQKVVADANQRLILAEQESDTMRAAKNAATKSAFAELSSEREAAREAQAQRRCAEEAGNDARRLLGLIEKDQERHLADHARTQAELQRAKDELAAARSEAADAQKEAKRWGDKVRNAETGQGTTCARLKRAEAENELLRSELDEFKADNEQLRVDLELKEQRLLLRGG